MTCRTSLAAILAVAISAPAYASRWELGPGPFAIHNLGPLIQANTLSDKFMFRTSAGATHLVLGYYYGSLSANRCELLDVNLETGEARKIVACYGRPFRMALLGNDKAYVISSAPGWLMEWDPVTGATRDIAPLADGNVQSHCIGTNGDGRLHIGESIKGYLEVYDPYTDVKTNYGIVDDPGPPYYRYVYTIGADERYDYCGMGQSPWYLVILDRQTGQQTAYWKDLANTSLTVSQATNGEWYCSRNGADGSHWYRLAGGVPVEVPANQVPPLKPWYMMSNVCHDISGFASYGYEVNLDDAYPDSSNGATATVRWRAIGATEWRTASVSGFGIAPMTLKRIYAPPGRDTLHGWAYPYGPNFNYDPLTNVATIVGNNQRSMYHCLFYDHRWYMVGYAAVMEEYDSTRPWTLKVSSPISDPAFNPHQVPINLNAKYYYYAARGADGLVYVAGHRERDATGGALGWYDPATGARGNVPYETLYQYDARDLIAADGGSKIVYSSVAINGAAEGKLFVLDTATKIIVAEYVPIPGAAETGKLAEVAPGTVCGVTAGNVYRLDIRSGALEYSLPLPGTAFHGIASYDRRLEKGPDGFLWLFIGPTPKLSRINPADGSVQHILTHDSMRNVCFKGGDAYLYADANLHVVRNLLVLQHRLDVLSEPIAGVPIAGAPGDTTTYSTWINDGAQVLLTAPQTFEDGSDSYRFICWRLNGADQQPGAAELIFNIFADSAAVAIYEYVPPTSTTTTESTTTTTSTTLPLVECVIDNRDDSPDRRFRVLAGTWASGSSLPDKYGPDYRYASTTAGQATARAMWSATVLPAGKYEVYAWWTSNSNRSRRVPFVIKDGATQLATVRLDQTVNSGRWNLLGTWDFSAGGHCVEIHNGQTRVNWTEQYICADAVKFVLVGATATTTTLASTTTTTLPQAEYVVDNSDASPHKEFRVLSGSWSPSSYLPGYWGSNYVYTGTTSGDETARARWSCTFVPAGRCEVYARWPANAERSRRVPYVIMDGAVTLATVRVDQTTGGGRWNLLGTWNFAGGAHAVEINNGQTKLYASEKYISADAVRFVPVP